MPAFPDSTLLTVLDTARKASGKILEIYESDFLIDFKKGKEPVTQADRIADRILIKNLRENFPDDAFLTEENGYLEGRIKNPKRVWFIDPIDGTKEFIKKNGEFAIQIALTENGALKMGLILQPVTGRVFAASVGRGCFTLQKDKTWKRILIRKRNTPKLVVALSRSHPSSLAIAVGKELGLTGIFEHGSVGLKLMAIAEGKAHYYLNDSNSTKAWDIAGPEILFKEAGGIVTDLFGRTFSYDPHNPFHKAGLLASANKSLHRKILAAIRPGVEKKYHFNNSGEAAFRRGNS